MAVGFGDSGSSSLATMWSGFLILYALSLLPSEDDAVSGTQSPAIVPVAYPE
jgi:hypothetical protein